VARKAAGREHGAIAATAEFDSDLDRLELLLQEAYSTSPLPPEATNVTAVDAFLVRMRKEHFA